MSGTYVLLCVLVPLIWGIVAAHVFDRVQTYLVAKRPRTVRVVPEIGRPKSDAVEPLVEMYYI